MIKQVSTNLPQVRGNRISQQMELGKVINRVTKFVQESIESMEAISFAISPSLTEMRE